MSIYQELDGRTEDMIQKEMSKLSINEVENAWEQGRYTDSQVDAYVEEWNKGPHFTTARRSPFGSKRIHLILEDD